MTFHFLPLKSWLTCMLIVFCCLGQDRACAQEFDTATDNNEPEEVHVIDADDDDTADIDTESSVDYDDYDRGVNLSGDVRPLINHFDEDRRDGTTGSDNAFRARLR